MQAGANQYAQYDDLSVTSSPMSFPLESSLKVCVVEHGLVYTMDSTLGGQIKAKRSQNKSPWEHEDGPFDVMFAMLLPIGGIYQYDRIGNDIGLEEGSQMIGLKPNNRIGPVCTFFYLL